MRALVIGAGAVGQVFGRHLALGGAEVTFLVKPAYADDARRGYTMYPLARGKPPAAVRFAGFGVITSAEEAAATRWDQVYLAVSSVALRAGTWLADVARATGDATIVFLQPNLDDRAVLTGAVDPARVVDGTIAFISYQAPLPGETRFAEPGMAYWFPPAPCVYSGAERPRVDAVVAALRAGKLPAKRVRDVPRMAPFPNAILYAYLSALEGARWSFATLRSGDYLRDAGRGAREAIAIAGKQVGVRPPLRIRLAGRPTVIRLGLRLAGRIVPIPLETYLRVHFTKTGAQTRLGMRAYVETGKRLGLPVGAIERLVNFLGPGDQSDST
jgi:2-dehydropantoate 2-reductase